MLFRSSIASSKNVEAKSTLVKSTTAKRKSTKAARADSVEGTAADVPVANAPVAAANAPAATAKAASEDSTSLAKQEVPQKRSTAELEQMLKEEDAAKQAALKQEQGGDQVSSAPSSDSSHKDDAPPHSDDVVLSDSGAQSSANETKGSGRIGTFPLITLRSIIITPAANVQLLAARENTVQALQEALVGGKGIAVFTQLVDGPGRPDKEDLGRIGVLAKVLNGSYNDKEQYRATIRGYERVIIRRIIDVPSNPVRHVEVEFLEEPAIDSAIERRYVEALRSALDNALVKGSPPRREGAAHFSYD